MFFSDLFNDAPEPRQGARPAVARLATLPGANIIVFRFAPGQCLNDHTAAHPITVQCVRGELDFTVYTSAPGSTATTTQAFRLRPGRVIHLDAYELHRVDAVDGCDDALLLLTMLTTD